MKKMVRSMVAASLAGVMAVSLAGCGGNKQTPAETTAAVTDAAKPGRNNGERNGSGNGRGEGHTSFYA